jgi:hypothetical protein
MAALVKQLIAFQITRLLAFLPIRVGLFFPRGQKYGAKLHLLDERGTNNQQGPEYLQAGERVDYNYADSTSKRSLDAPVRDHIKSLSSQIANEEFRSDHILIRDDSSVSSQDSSWTSLSALSKISTLSSVQSIPISTRFASGLIGLRGVDTLLKECFALSTPDRCERNIRRLLKELGARLVSEASHDSQRFVARAFVKHHSEIAADIKLLCSTRALSEKLYH